MAYNPTSFPTPLNATCNLLLGDGTGNAVMASCTGSAPTTAGAFQHGCIMYQTDTSTGTAAIYQNIGSVAVPSWSLMDTASSSFTLPVAATDAATTTTTSFALTTSAITTGTAQSITAAAATTGKVFRAVATAATLTTGRYFEANDGAANVFGIGANGHVHTAQTTAPTIAVSQQNGITAAAITAGGSDVCGVITTTGTNNNGGTTILQVTFNKTYTTAPKAIQLMPLNAAGAAPNPPFISAVTATTFDITIPASGTAGATPSWNYIVLA